MANPSKVLSVVSEIASFGEGVYQVRFSVPIRYTRFLPGQFLHLTLDEFDPTTGYWPESRVFSIASEPRQDSVAIVYSVKGTYTKRMERELRVGRQVWLKLPYGDFIISKLLLEKGPLALIAGGTGISPFWPFLKESRDLNEDVHLFYGIKRPENLLFTSDLVALKMKSWFKFHLMIEEVTTFDFPFEQGRLSIEWISRCLGASFTKASFFLSGPPMMIQSFREVLGDRGVPSERIYFDNWE